MRNGKRNEGSSLICVVFMVALLSVVSVGYMCMADHNMRYMVRTRKYREARTAAKSIHQSFCEAVSCGESEAMDQIWDMFEEDCGEIREEMEAMEEEESEGEDREDMEDEDEYGYDWKLLLKERLGEKEYTAVGHGEHEEKDMEVEITLKAVPAKGQAVVHTVVTYSGYHISLAAQILFDNKSGDRIEIPPPEGGSWSEACEAAAFYRTGNGVYRYYEEEEGSDHPGE